MEAQLVTSTVFGLAETALNKLLQLDPATLGRVQQLNGKKLRVECTAPPVDLYVQPCTDGLSLFTRSDATADSTITGSAPALLALLIASDRQQALNSGDLTISGDIELSQELQRILDQLDIDWEAQLAEWIGDIAAHQLGNQLRSLFKWGRQASNSMIMNVEEFLHEEARTMPPRAELEQFYSGIEAVSLDTDRLAARIARLEERITNNNQKSDA